MEPEDLRPAPDHVRYAAVGHPSVGYAAVHTLTVGERGVLWGRLILYENHTTGELSTRWEQDFRGGT